MREASIIKLARVSAFGAYISLVFFALTWLVRGYQNPDVVWDASTASSPASVIIAMLAGTVGSALGGALCSPPIYFVYWLLWGRIANAMRHE